MQIEVILNRENRTLHVAPHERLLRVLRREAIWSVKFGDEHGKTGCDAVLLNGKLVNSNTILAVQCHDMEITTLEGIGTSRNLHPLQEAFIETGAIQSRLQHPRANSGGVCAAAKKSQPDRSRSSRHPCRHP